MYRKYSYMVVSVDETVKQMLVNYSSEGLKSVMVSMPLPSIDETVESVVSAYAPFSTWDEQLREVIAVTPGTAGTVEVVQPVTPETESVAFVDDFEPVTFKLI